MQKKETNKPRLVCIDSDSLVFIVGSSMADITKVNHGTRLRVNNSVDSLIGKILRDTQADYYIGHVAAIDQPKVRLYKIAKTKPYKGNRKEKPTWFAILKPIIVARMKSKWGFTVVTDDHEVDAHTLQNACYYRDSGDYDVVVSLMDKDLKQIHPPVGIHVYTTNKFKTQAITYPTIQDSLHQLWFLILAGDNADNFGGLPGIGEKKTNEILEGCTNEYSFFRAAAIAYIKAFKETLPNKAVKKMLQNEFDEWKRLNKGQRLTKAIKEEIQKSIQPIIDETFKYLQGSSMWKTRLKEMYDLAKLPDTGNYFPEIPIIPPTKSPTNSFRAQQQTMKEIINQIL